jgi:hypothetical protein
MENSVLRDLQEVSNSLYIRNENGIGLPPNVAATIVWNSRKTTPEPIGYVRRRLPLPLNRPRGFQTGLPTTLPRGTFRELASEPLELPDIPDEPFF